MVYRLLVTILLVGFLALAPGAEAPAATAVEYGGLVKQSQAGGGGNHQYKSLGKRPKSLKKGKARR